MNQFLLIKATLLELTSTLLLFSGESDTTLIASFIGSHLLASAILSWLAWTVIPGKYRYPVYYSYSLFMALIFFIPFFGFFGIASAMVIALRTPRRKTPRNFRCHDIPPMPEKPGNFMLTTQYSAGGMRAVLEADTPTDKKIGTVMYTRNLGDKEAVPLLRIALRDQADDVRLLAYSMLDQKETAINLTINEIKEQLELLDHGSPSQRALLLLQLADHYWELSYLGYSQGELRLFNLERARNHLNHSIELDDTPTAQALLGKVEFALGEYTKAQAHFEHASGNGLAPEVFLPYMAEIAYRNHDYDLTHKLICRLPSELSNLRLAQLREYWL